MERDLRLVTQKLKKKVHVNLEPCSAHGRAVKKFTHLKTTHKPDVECYKYLNPVIHCAVIIITNQSSMSSDVFQKTLLRVSLCENILRTLWQGRQNWASVTWLYDHSMYHKISCHIVGSGAAIQFKIFLRKQTWEILPAY